MLLLFWWDCGDTGQLVGCTWPTGKCYSVAMQDVVARKKVFMLPFAIWPSFDLGAVAKVETILLFQTFNKSELR